MPDDLGDFFAPPPFDPAAARQTLARTLRDLQLAERAGAFEWKGQPAVRATVDGAQLVLEVVKRPGRTPDWEKSSAKDHAQLRRFVDEVKKRTGRWADSRSDD